MALFFWLAERAEDWGRLILLRNEVSQLARLPT
jgi:hypothetical protein